MLPALSSCALGVITGKDKVNRERIFKLLNQLTMAFKKENTEKKEIIDIIKSYLSNFEHIETGKSLDNKM